MSLRKTCRAGSPCSILLIEDEIFVAELLRHGAAVHEPGCYNFVHALTLEDAGAKFKAILYDLVIVDLGLNTSEGVATFLTARDIVAGRAPIAVLTGSNDAETELRCFDEGAFAYVIKPIISVEHFLGRCRGWILKYRRDMEIYRRDMEMHDVLLRENEALRQVQRLLWDSQAAQRRQEDQALEQAQERIDARVAVREQASSVVVEVAEQLFSMARAIGARYQGQGNIETH